MMVTKLAGRMVVATPMALVLMSGVGVPVSQASSWSQQADATCGDIQDSMGMASRTGDPFADMAMFDYWHAKVLLRMADALSGIGGGSQRTDAFIDGLASLADLENEEADYSAERSLTHDLTTPITNTRNAMRAQAQVPNIPTCDAIINV